MVSGVDVIGFSTVVVGGITVSATVVVASVTEGAVEVGVCGVGGHTVAVVVVLSSEAVVVTIPVSSGVGIVDSTAEQAVNRQSKSVSNIKKREGCFIFGTFLFLSPIL